MSSKKISLTIAERYDIVKYAHQIPSSWVTYFLFPEFLEVIQITDEEAKEYDVKVVDGTVECNCPDRKFEYDQDSFPKQILDTIALYVQDVQAQIDEEKKNTPDHSASPLYEKIVESLSKIL